MDDLYVISATHDIGGMASAALLRLARRDVIVAAAPTYPQKETDNGIAAQ